MITVTAKGDFTKTEKFLERMREAVKLGSLDKYGRQGVAALAQATPKDSGKTANSWKYKIEHKGNSVSIIWENTNTNKGANIAVLIQYGHATGWGGYVKGVDYINPAMKPVFENIATNVWKEVSG